MRYLPIVLLVGILLNFGCIVVFRLKLDRRYRFEFENFSSQIRSQIISFSDDALRRIDSYVASNRIDSSYSPRPSDSPRLSSSDVLFSDGGVWDYHFQRIDGIPFARVGIVDFSVGSSFPRGGFITAIYPDYVVVNDSISFRNSSYSSFRPSVSLSTRRDAEDSLSDVSQYKPSREVSDYVERMGAMR